ncbi:MAG: hypothetical protein DI534_15445 [Leifsonia xyli]|nr:MAG: hypothetical protein DI534_15445 [Leifsonia xyli]
MDLHQSPGAEPKEPSWTANMLVIVCAAISMAAGFWIAMAATHFFFPEPWSKPGAPYHASVAWLVRDFPEPRPPQNYWDIAQDAGFAASWLTHKVAATIASVVTFWPVIAFVLILLFTFFLSFFVMWRLFLERIYDGRWPARRAS